MLDKIFNANKANAFILLTKELFLSHHVCRDITLPDVVKKKKKRPCDYVQNEPITFKHMFKSNYHTPVTSEVSLIR